MANTLEIDEMWDSEGKFYIRWEWSDGGRFTKVYDTQKEYQEAFDKHKNRVAQAAYTKYQEDELKRYKERQRKREISSMFTIGNILKEKR